jgi:PAS domain-containing protein
MRLKLPAVMSLATVVIVMAPLTGFTGPLLKWTDENGRIHYGDRIPPKYAKQERKILNEQGIEVKTIDAAKTPEQLAEEKRLAQQREEQQRLAAKQASHDRMLLATFSTEDDIVMTRDGKIAAIDAVLRVTRGRIERTEQSLEALTHRAAELERSGKRVPDSLHEEIRGARAQIQLSLDYIADKRREQEVIRQEFESDIRRFRELKAAQAEGPET